MVVEAPDFVDIKIRVMKGTQSDCPSQRQTDKEQQNSRLVEGVVVFAEVAKAQKLKRGLFD
jgi:hypothetical protein